MHPGWPNSEREASRTRSGPSVYTERTVAFGVAVLAALGMAQCTSDSDSARPTTSSSTVSGPTAGPVSQAPSTTTPGRPAPPEGPPKQAANCSPQQPGSAARVTLRLDRAEPECQTVGPPQTLQIVNATGASVTTQLGAERRTIAAGQTARIAEPFVAYLLPGVHILHVNIYAESGPTINLQAP